jgi:TatA/E family protein of Tat protein translocase
MHPALAPLAFIDGLGGPEMMLVFVIVLLLFGGQKLPEFARGLGKTMREFKKAAAGVEDEFKRALEEDERKKNETALTAAPATAALAAPKDNPAAVAAADPYHDNSPHDSYYDHDHSSEAGPEVQTAAADPVATPSAAGTEGTTPIVQTSPTPSQPLPAAAPAIATTAADSPTPAPEKKQPPAAS